MVHQSSLALLLSWHSKHPSQNLHDLKNNQYEDSNAVRFLHIKDINCIFKLYGRTSVLYVHYSSDSKTVQLTSWPVDLHPTMHHALVWGIWWHKHWSLCLSTHLMQQLLSAHLLSGSITHPEWWSLRHGLIVHGLFYKVAAGLLEPRPYSFVWKILILKNRNVLLSHETSPSYSCMSLAMIQPFNNYQTSDVHTFQYHHLLKRTSNTLFST